MEARGAEEHPTSAIAASASRALMPYREAKYRTFSRTVRSGVDARRLGDVADAAAQGGGAGRLARAR